MSNKPSYEELEERIKQLEKTEKELNLIFELSPDLAGTVNLNRGYFTRVNHTWEIFGRSLKEFLERPFFDFVHPDDQNATSNVVDAIQSGQFITKFENRYRCKNGSYKTIEWHATPAQPDGTTFVSGRDVTERRQSEKALRESETLLKSLIRAIPDLVWLKDPEGIFLFCNSRLEKLFGLNEKDIIGKTDYDITNKELADSFRKHDKIAIAKGKPSKNEEEVTFVDDGHREILETIKTPMYRSNGQLIGVLGIGRDITDRKRAEEALQDSESFIKLVMDKLPIGLAVHSVELPALKFEYMNDNFLKLFRTTREALADPDAFWISAFEDPEFREEITKRIMDAYASGDLAQLHWEDVPITRKGEKTSFISAQNVPVPNKALMISTVWDVTDRKQAEDQKARLEAQLHQSQKMESIGTLAGGVAHDYNNMLSIIIGYAEMIMENLDSNDPIYKDAAQIYNAGKRSSDITRQLLAFARKQTIQPIVIDLNQNINSMLKMLRRLIGEDIDLAWLPVSNLWHLKIDPSQVDQILANLCVNARDAINGVGQITIETANVDFDEEYCADHSGFIPGDFLMLAVSDNGIGMEPETLNKIFEPFFTTKGVHEGTGLGLSTVYGIVKQNNGFINVYSEPGKGTTIKCYFSRHAGDTFEIKHDSITELPLGQGETILLVEDDNSILKLGERMLKSLGYSVLPGSTPQKAINLAKKNKDEIDLLITDVVMPEMNGKELSEKIQNICPGLKILYMSGYTANVIAHHGVLDDGIFFISKPLSKKELAIKVKELLDKN